MKVKVCSDVFNISARIKDIDKDYFIVYDTIKNVFEIHNYKNAINTYSLTLPYSALDIRTLDIVHKTDIRNIDKILKDVDKHNEKIKNKIKNNINDRVNYQANEIYSYADSTSKDYEANKSYKNKWF